MAITREDINTSLPSIQKAMVGKVGELLRTERKGGKDLGDKLAKIEAASWMTDYLENYIVAGTVLTEGVSSQSTLDFSTFNATTLADGMSIDIIVSGSNGYLVGLAAYIGNYYGFTLNQFIEDIAIQIELQSLWSAVRVNSTLVIDAPETIGAIPNGSSVQIIFADYYAVVKDKNVGATASALNQIAVAPITRTVYATNPSSNAIAYNTVADTIANPAISASSEDVVFLPLEGHRGYSRQPLGLLTTSSTWGGDVRLSDGRFFYTTSNALQVVDSTNTIIDTVILTAGFEQYTLPVVNQSTGKIYVFNTNLAYREITWTGPGLAVVGPEISLPIPYAGDLGNACYSAFNQSVYVVHYGNIVRINSAGVFANSVVVLNTISYYWIGVNPYNGNIYAKPTSLQASVYTYSPTLSLLSTQTISSSVGQMGIDVGTSNATLRMYAIGSSGGNIFEYDSSFNQINQFNFYIGNSPSLTSCYFSKQTRHLILVAINAVPSQGYDVLTYSIAEQKLLMRYPIASPDIDNFINQFFEDATNNIWLQEGLNGLIRKLIYRDYSSYTQGQLWIQSSGTSIKIYYINGTSLVLSDFFVNNNEYGLGRIRAHSDNSVSIYAETNPTFLFPYFIHVDATNLVGFPFINGSNLGGFKTEVSPSTIGLYKIDSIVYKPYGQLFMIGTAYPVASGISEMHIFSITGGWQGRINNGFVTYKAIAYNELDGLIYAIDGAGRLKSYDGSALPLSDIPLSFTPSISGGVEMIYDSYYDKLVVLNGVGGDIFIINPYTGDVYEPIGTPISGYSFRGITTDNQGRIYVNVFNTIAAVGRILSISFINGDQINISGIFAGGETMIVWQESQNCLSQEEVEGMYEEIKSWLGVSLCGDQDFSMPDSPYSLQNRLLTASTGLFITTALGQYIAT
jgi:hypothetical protein